MRKSVWERLRERFPRAHVLEFYASTEGNAVLANPSGKKVGSLGKALPGSTDLALLGWSADNGDPDNFLYVMFDPENAEPGSARNLAFYKNPELHGILVWAQETTDRAERERYYKRAQDLIARDAPWVPLAHAEVVVAARSSLWGVMVHPSSNIYFHRVTRR